MSNSMDKKTALIQAMQDAIDSIVAEWDAEREIEKLLGYDIDACTITLPNSLSPTRSWVPTISETSLRHSAAGGATHDGDGM
jgi:hypothetical protein